MIPNEDFDSFCDGFSYQVERHKLYKRFDNYIDALIDFLSLEETKKVYDFITFDNVKKYLNRSIREKLLVDFKTRNMIKKEFNRKHKNLF
jgi:hypothetical protein